MSLEINGLQQEYEDFTLGPLDLSVEPGVTAVLGPSGSGKSTLLSLIAGFEAPDAGGILVDGRPLENLPPEDRSVGMVFQNYALFPHLSVRENLAFGATEEGDVKGTAAMLEIEPLLDRDPETLSGGEAQRVALARALVSSPDVLLLDEPLSSLDAPIRRRLRLELRDVLSNLSIPVVYVTHDQEEAAVVGDRLAVLHEGDLVREGAVEDVFQHPKSAFVAEFLGLENVFPAEVMKNGTEETVVDLGSSTLVAAGSPPDGPVAVAIHPDSIELRETTSERKANGNAIPCSVERVLTQHTDATIVLQCGEDRLTASVSRKRAALFSVGDRCQAAVDPADVYLTRRDR